MNVKVSTKTRLENFCDLKVGIAFLHKFKPFMKTPSCLDPNDDDTYNAVDLENGFLVSFGADEVVEPLEGAELTVWR